MACCQNTERGQYLTYEQPWEWWILGEHNAVTVSCCNICTTQEGDTSLQVIYV